jgi:stage IV sporulation protein FA
MEIRDNVRRRRRERILQLTGEASREAAVRREGGAALRDGPGAANPAPVPPSAPYRTAEKPAPPSETERPVADQPEPIRDPEKWWKEQQKRLNRMEPSWRGVRQLALTSVPPGGDDSGRRPFSRFAAGFAVRMAISAALLAGAWGWFRFELPGGREAKEWTARAVSEDMDFGAMEAWYAEHFGGSPGFLPVFRTRGETREVFGAWDRGKAEAPVRGRIVQTFAQNGGGVRIAASAGSEVKAVSAGRVLQVSEEADGKTAIRIQHAGKIVTVYGNVEQPAVQENDWVETGQKLGIVPAPRDESGESLLYFAVMRDGRPVDPAEVVPLD